MNYINSLCTRTFFMISFLTFVSFIPVSSLRAYQPESAIVEINTEGIQQPPFETYLSFIRTQDGRIYGVEDLEAFKEMKWEVGDPVALENVANVIKDEMFPKSKVLLTLKNHKNNENVTVTLLKHPISRYLHSSIETIHLGHIPESYSLVEPSYYSNNSSISLKPSVDIEEPSLSNVKLFDGRVYAIKSFKDSFKEDWKTGDAIEEDYVVNIEKGNKGPQVIILLRNLSQNNEAEAVLLKDAS